MAKCPNCDSERVMADGDLCGVCNECGYAWDNRPDEAVTSNESEYWRRLDTSTFAVRTGVRLTEMGLRRAISLIPFRQRPQADTLYWWDGEFEENSQRWVRIKFASVREGH